MKSPDLTLGIMWYAVFVFSTTLHEAAHAWSALRLGDDTAHRGGQVTLDPTPHIRREPVGMILIPILSYVFSGWMIGWASAPYDPFWAVRHPRKSALMSLAGPASNLLLVILAGIGIRVGMAFNFLVAPEFISFTHVTEALRPGGTAFATLLSIVFSLNLLLCVFNLLPLPPLDGSGALLMFLKPDAAAKFLQTMSSPGFGFFGIFVAWKVFGTVYPPIHLFVVNLLYPGVTYG